MRIVAPLTLLALGTACSEYDFKGEDPPPDEPLETAVPPVTDTEDTAPIVDTSPVEDTDDDCEPFELAAAELPADDCFAAPKTGTFTPVVEWTKQTFTVQSSSNNVMMTPIVASLTDDNGDGAIDDDDIPDVILVTYASWDGYVRAISGDGGAELWTYTATTVEGQSTPAAADIDGDGLVEILVPTNSYQIMALEHDGTLKWTSPNLASHIDTISDTVAVSDMDGDGSPEIICGRAILNADGTIRGTGAYGIGMPTASFAAVGATSFAVDIDGDGVQEVVVGNALYRPDGSAIWNNGQADGYPAVANFDADPAAEIVVAGNGNIRLQDDDGTVLWSAAIPGAAGGYGGPPTIADYDGDLEPEIGVAAYSSYTVFDTDGSMLWQMPTQDGSSGVTGSAVFDFEADGVAEAVYADETRLWVFNGPDGAIKLESADHSNATWNEYASIVDVDGDGHAEIVVPNTSTYRGVTVIGDLDDSWRPGTKIWNQHAFHITNINPDGTVPAVADRNWLSYNNFRSGDTAAGDPPELPDLVVEIVDVCRIDCDEDVMPVTIRVGNAGDADVEGPLTATIFGTGSSGGAPIAIVPIPGPIRAKMWEATITVEITGMAGSGYDDLLVQIAPDKGELVECDDENNNDTWGEDVCE